MAAACDSSGENLTTSSSLSKNTLLASSDKPEILKGKSSDKLEERDVISADDGDGPIQMKQTLGLFNGVGIIVGIIIGE